MMLRTTLLVFGSVMLGSCAQQDDSSLVINFIPKETLVLDFSAFSCRQVLEGVRTADGAYVTPIITGPVVQFNRISMEWKKTTKLALHTIQIKFKGSGIEGGSTKCDLTYDLPALFETSTEGNTVSFDNGIFQGKGKIYTNSKCRIACSIPLEDPEVPEISAVGEVIVKASEITNEGTDNEKIFRVRTRINVRVRP